MKSYFKITSGSLYTILNEISEQNKLAQAAAKEWGKKYPEIEGIRGLCVTFVEGHVPTGNLWRKHKKGGFTPNKGCKEGKALAAEMAALPSRPGGMQVLMAMMTVSTCKDIMRVNQTGTPGIKQRGSDFYLACDDCWLPKNRAGIEEIKASEYESIQRASTTTRKAA
ncbi:hypothetical protein GCM10023213_14340 [Prosthecobacter algae]|uniref:Uncharacterized protein n=1 Tax=Prosthecobacter algae TaxID=1144682 RepID=A0ABP9NZ10_9BACT